MKLRPSTLAELRSQIQQLCGLVIPEEKAYLIEHRLPAVAKAHECASFEEFAQELRSPRNTALRDDTISAITTNETSFFRDRHPFAAFKSHVLPLLCDRLQARRERSLLPNRVRIWCAAVATGQEAYSLAMILREALPSLAERGLSSDDFEVLGTDISSAVLAVANAGTYTERDIARGLTDHLRSKHFQEVTGGWVVRGEVRKLVEFRRLNLVQPFPALGAFDAIFCRNVLIYFDEATRRQICIRLADALVADGLLCLGSAESLFGIANQFESIQLGGTMLFQKKQSGMPPGMGSQAQASP